MLWFIRHRPSETEFLGPSRDTQNACAAIKGGTVFKTEIIVNEFKTVNH